MKMGLACGDLWQCFIEYITATVDNYNYTIEPTDKNYSGESDDKKHQSIAVFPISDYLANDENNQSKATFNFQLINRLSGKNTYGQITPFIAEALNLTSDILLILNRAYFDDSIVDIDSVSHDPVGVSRIEGDANSDWLIVCNINFRVTWNNYYSDLVCEAGYDDAIPLVTTVANLESIS